MALAAGDIAIIAYNSDGIDDFAWVTLVDIPANTTLNFTDSSWQDNGFRTSEHLDATGGGPLTWSHSNTVTAGTVIKWSGSAWDLGTSSGTTLTLSASGDQIFIYTGTVANPVFIYGAHFATATNWLSSGSNSTNTSNIPPGLSTAVGTAFYVGNFDNGYYTGTTTGTKAELLAAISNTTNWQRNDTGPLSQSNWKTAFTLAGGLPTVNLLVSSNTGTEAGQTAITVTATASSGVSGNQTVNLDITGTGIFVEDYTLSNTTITIPNGQTEGSVTFNIVDDALIEGTETATLTISNPSAGITLGGTTTQNITITDNDVAPIVNLSVSSNTGTEAETTVITVTATASSTVSGNQTVNLGVSGTGITTSDYYLSNITITIPNGQTSGSVTFIVADDAIVEGTETAILTISNPSAGISLGATTSQNITISNNDSSFLTKIGGITSANGAEIPAFDPESDRLFVVAGNTVEIYTVSNTGSLAASGSLTPGITSSANTVLIPNSVAVKNGVVAVAYAVQDTTTNAQLTGKVAFFNAADGSFISAVDVGALPDMLTFTPDSTKILVANEGEPNSYSQANSVDPEGSVSIINITNGVANATVQTATFTSFNSQINSLKAAGVRIIGLGATVAQDLEPEYITVSGDGLTARITLQENNAIAILDIASATITQILPLGRKNHNLPGNGIDPSDQDGGINIRNMPVFGLYQPDAIASFTVNGQTYYITANEGDSRNYTGFNEEVRVGNSSYILDPTVFPNATTLKQDANLGRFQLTNATGDTDGDGDFDSIEAFGARSFSIWDTNGTQVFDSGDQLEQITATKTPTLFNSDGNAVSFDARSDNKGPEPEGVVVGVINNRTYVFIGLERTGDVIVYDVSNPNQPTFVQYINTPEDISPEGLTFISATDSPTGKPLLVIANEVSKTVAVFEINPPIPISYIQGTPGVDKLHGTADDDVIDGLDGNDYLFGRAGNDTLNGGSGTDYGFGGDGDDSISGGDGSDFLYGNTGNDHLLGGEGGDNLDGGEGDDSLEGGAGNDIYTLDSLGDQVIEVADGGIDKVNASISWDLGNNDHVENLTLMGNITINGIGNTLNNHIIGNNAANTLDGGEGDDWLMGTGGDDNLIGGNGNDRLDGGTGSDRLEGGAGNDIYEVDSLQDQIIEAPDAGTDTVISIITWTLDDNLENLTLVGNQAIDGTGNAADNRLMGNSADNILQGLEGNDQLFGNAGIDILRGGLGSDRLEGGRGADIFDLTGVLNGGFDTVVDFKPGEDIIHISASEFGLSAGTLNPGLFVLGTSANTDSQRFIYNQVKGELFFDADGSGSNAQVQIALFSNRVALTSDSFLLSSTAVPLARAGNSDVFTISSSNQKANLTVTLVNTNAFNANGSAFSVNELGLFIVDDAQGRVNGLLPGEAGYTQAALGRAQVLLSGVPNFPGQMSGDRQRLLELNSGENFRFYLVRNTSLDNVNQGTTPVSEVLFGTPSHLQITDLGSSVFSIAWEDGIGANDFQDLVVTIESTNQPLTPGTELQTKPQGEVLDLRAFTGAVGAEFTVTRDSLYNNYVGFYRVANENGGIDTNGDGVADIYPGSANYITEAISRRVSGIDLTLGATPSIAIYQGSFLGDAMYAPFIIADGRPSDLLNGVSIDDPAVYFPYLGANVDGRDHLRLLGDNYFGFEDLPLGNTDFDFNDFTIKANLLI
ncbi:Ca2+-binding protein, RTX toxin [Nostoc sp. PCC 7524]|uniref:choice-of-anchor I family protein n=1 Tax=Nostoc sp. (strain ATCC 29411 / PCC 7524) TaxID=28072 RepID=UPI00029F2888|nr:choice-of-anchor I family protein [Nostoc sp. PCC 7524]AFY46475.1 Ca2+-binding protein, RTX toxin [Nostoc sp. PCC 7524]